ncbi:MAG TPA: cupin domain-containing protein [Candidatus Limnocylindrales bacterium]
MSHPSSTYPPSRYDGEEGLVSARLRRSETEPEVRYKNGGTADYLATGESTNGQFGLYRWNMSATRSGPDPHFHRSISESFFVISGTIKLFDGREWIDAKPGDFLFVPEGGIHGFRNESGEDASMLILFAPGAPREDYFETLARVSMGESMTDDERTAFMLRHDTFWV